MKRVPLRKCRRCVHFRRETCHLADLEPCTFVPTDEAKDSQMRTRLGWIATAIAAVAIAAIILFAGCKKKPEPTFVPKWSQVSAVELLRNQHKGELTEWQMLQMAIIWTESKANPLAVGSSGDYGLYQMTDVYVREVNRIAGTDYAHEDAFDPEKAVEIFNTMQGAKNPHYDLDMAIYYHNKNSTYKQTVLKNLELARRYEMCRKLIVNYANRTK